MDGILHFVASGMSGGAGARHGDDDEELGNSYQNWAEDDASFQERYDRDVGENWFRAASSFIPSFAKPSAPDVDSAGGLLYSMTPSFLKSSEDDDFASACCPNMGFRQRLFGCACCLLAGQLIQFFSFGAFAGVLLGHPGRFACLYTLGNLTMVASSFFLSGPAAQCRRIQAKDRAATSAIYFTSMALTLVSVFSHHYPGRALVILACVAVQWVSLIWYVLSFVPYGQTTARKLVRGMGGFVCRW